MIKVNVNFDAIYEGLNEIQKSKLGYASANALKKTTKRVTEELGQQALRHFKSTVPFTRNAFAYSRYVNFKTPVGRVWIKPWQYSYLYYQIQGGTRTPLRRAILVPQKPVLNAAGRMPRKGGAGQNKFIDKLLADPNVFSGTIKTKDGKKVAGIWRRGYVDKGGRFRSSKKSKANRQLKLLIAYEPEVAYKKKFPYTRIVHATVHKYIGTDFATAMEQEMRTLKK